MLVAVYLRVAPESDVDAVNVELSNSPVLESTFKIVADRLVLNRSVPS